ncbi:MAG: hypothetical protein ACT4OL_10625 [Nitrospiraceae bacterium]
MRSSVQHHATYCLVVAFAVSFFAVGVPYWQVPYAKLSLPNTLYGTGLLVVGVLSAAARAACRARLLAVIFTVGAAVPTVIFVRVAVDAAKDPTSHNLWPFEVIIAATVGVLCSTAGALTGSLFTSLSRHNDKV